MEEEQPKSDDETTWFMGFEQELGITVSSNMAQKLVNEKNALKRKIQKLVGATFGD